MLLALRFSEVLVAYRIRDFYSLPGVCYLVLVGDVCGISAELADDGQLILLPVQEMVARFEGAFGRCKF